MILVLFAYELMQSLIIINNNYNSLYFQRVTHLAKYRLIFHEALCVC